MSKDRTIAQLRRKLGLLVEYGYFTDLGAVADALGTKRKTMESWADTGADRATPGLIPRMKYRDVVELFEKPIRENDGSLNVEAVVQGGVLELEQRLMPPSAIAISRLIARDAVHTNGSIFIEKTKPLGAITRRSEARPEGANIVRTSDWFRIEFSNALKKGHAIGLQQCRRHWSFLSLTRRAGEAHILVPGLDGAGKVDWMQEQEWLGINRFIVVETLAPWPRHFLTAFEGDVPLDSGLLHSITEFYETQAPKARSLSVVDVDICSSQNF